MKNVFDTVFKCDCLCKNELSIGDFKDGQFSFTIKEKGNFYEAVINPKDIKAIIKLLSKYK